MEMVELEETQKGVYKSGVEGPYNARERAEWEGTGGEGLVFHFFPLARRTKAIVEDPIVED